MPEPTVPDPQPGWSQVVVVAGAVVVVILGAAFATSVLPVPVQQLVFHTPLAIAVLLVGTAWVLWRIARRDPRNPD